MSQPKIHIHDEQFDGQPHAWCGRGSTAAMPLVFEATDPALRCKVCEREWFPRGQPAEYLEHAKQRLKESAAEPAAADQDLV